MEEESTKTVREWRGDAEHGNSKETSPVTHTLLGYRGPLAKRRQKLNRRHLLRRQHLQQRRGIVLLRQLQLRVRQQVAGSRHRRHILGQRRDLREGEEDALVEGTVPQGDGEADVVLRFGHFWWWLFVLLISLFIPGREHMRDWTASWQTQGPRLVSD